MNKLSVSAKIWIGFGSVLTLLVLIGGISSFSLFSVGSLFGDYRTIAVESNEISRVQANMLMTRMGVKDFLLRDDEASVTMAKERANVTERLIHEARTAALSPQQAALLDSFAGEVAAYQATFEKVVKLQEQRNTTFVTLQETGEQMLVALEQAIKRNHDSGLNDDAYAAATTLQHLLVARINASVFLSTNKADSFENAASILQHSEADLSRLMAIFRDPTARTLVETANTQRALYLSNLQAIQDTIVQRNELITGSLDVIGPRIASAIEKHQLETKARQDTLGPAAVASIQNTVMIVSALAVAAVALGLFLAAVISRAITKPLPFVERAMRSAEGGDLTVRAAVTTQDEVGQMASNLNGLLGRFQTGIGEVSEVGTAIAAAAEELNAASNELNRHAERMSSESSQADEAVAHVTQAISDLSTVATQLSASAETVAAASEELNASIAEVAHHAEQSSNVAHQARQEANSATKAIDGAMTEMGNAKEAIVALSEAAQEISAVIQVIRDIAEQTNLLALNATIEAARAGEAGKGFAVVANEVKNLANQSSRATEDITRRIHAVQEQVGRSVGSMEAVGRSLDTVHEEMGDINQIILKIDEIAASIASEVQQQGAATTEIGSNVEHVAQAARQVAEDVGQTKMDAQTMKHAVDSIAEIAQETAGEATETSAASGELTRLAQGLDTMVKSYKVR